jgi:hypothetical protein
MITCPTCGEIERRDFNQPGPVPPQPVDNFTVNIDNKTVLTGRAIALKRAKPTIRGREVSRKIDLARMALEKESLSRIKYIKEEAWREPIWARLKEAAYSISMSILWLGGLIAMTLLYCFIFDAALCFIPASSSWRWSSAFILGFVAAGLTMMMVLSLVAVCMDRHEPSAWVVLLILLLILCTGMGMWVGHIRAASAGTASYSSAGLTPPVVVSPPPL